MSDHFLVVIPQDPTASLPNSAESIREALAEIAGTTEARIKNYGKLQFIDAGENSERIGCPTCGHTFTVPEWHEWMGADWHGDEGFHLHRHETKCCGTSLTLNELVYEWPQGFASWMISARNANRGQLSETEIRRLEGIAGIPLKAITQMY